MEALKQIPFDSATLVRIESLILQFQHYNHLSFDLQLSNKVLHINVEQKCVPILQVLPKYKITAYVKSIFEGSMPDGYKYEINAKCMDL